MPYPSDKAMGIMNRAWRDVSKIIGASPPNVVSVVSRIGRRRLRPVVSHDERDFDLFYHTMYLPYIRARFGELVTVANEASWRRRFRFLAQ